MPGLRVGPGARRHGGGQAPAHCLTALRRAPKRPGRRLTGMPGDADLAALGSVIGDRSRARILLALGDGRALPATVLAAEAGVAASTASGHLGRLIDAGLLDVAVQGRHRYYRLAGP